MDAASLPNPLQKHIDQVPKLEVDSMVATSKLHVPTWLSKEAAMALNNLICRVAGAHISFSDASKSLLRKWWYAGHLLRAGTPQENGDIANQALGPWILGGYIGFRV